jgi:hypothetical protein
VTNGGTVEAMSGTSRPDLDQVRDALRRRDERQTAEEADQPAPPAPDAAEDADEDSDLDDHEG